MLTSVFCLVFSVQMSGISTGGAPCGPTDAETKVLLILLIKINVIIFIRHGSSYGTSGIDMIQSAMPSVINAALYVYRWQCLEYAPLYLIHSYFLIRIYRHLKESFPPPDVFVAVTLACNCRIRNIECFASRNPSVK